MQFQISKVRHSDDSNRCKLISCVHDEVPTCVDASIHLRMQGGVSAGADSGIAVYAKSSNTARRRLSGKLQSEPPPASQGRVLPYLWVDDTNAFPDEVGDFHQHE